MLLETLFLHSHEQHTTLRDAIIISISSLRPNPQTNVTVRVDNASSFMALRNDTHLNKYKIVLDYGRVHNKNKNPIVDKGIRELSSEILRAHPDGGPISSDQLAVSVNQLNSCIRN